MLHEFVIWAVERWTQMYICGLIDCQSIPSWSSRTQLWLCLKQTSECDQRNNIQVTIGKGNRGMICTKVSIVSYTHPIYICRLFGKIRTGWMNYLFEEKLFNFISIFVFIFSHALLYHFTVLIYPDIYNFKHYFLVHLAVERTFSYVFEFIIKDRLISHVILWN